MGIPREAAEHLGRLPLGAGLAENPAVMPDDGVGGDDHVLRRAEGFHLPGLVGGQRHHKLSRAEPFGGLFLSLRGEDDEIPDAQHLQQFLPPGRPGGQYD